MEYEISYTGMDGAQRTESHVGDCDSLNRLVTFLEERGAHCIAVEVADEQESFIAGRTSKISVGGLVSQCCQ